MESTVHHLAIMVYCTTIAMCSGVPEEIFASQYSTACATIYKIIPCLHLLIALP